MLTIGLTIGVILFFGLIVSLMLLATKEFFKKDDGDDC